MHVPTITVRAEEPDDASAVDTLLRGAFGCENEARLAERLRGTDELIVSLAATSGEQIAGYIAFARAGVAGAGGMTEVAWLAPLAVQAGARRRGIGKDLVYAGLESCLMMGLTHAIVLGDPAYYGRFGFSLENASGLESRWPRQGLMAIHLDHDAPPLSGMLTEPQAFAALDTEIASGGR